MKCQIPAALLALAMHLSGCAKPDRSSAKRSSNTPGSLGSAVSPRNSAGGPASTWVAGAAALVEQQLQRELFVSTDSGYRGGLEECDDEGEEQAPPGLALVKVALLPDAVTWSDSEPKRAIVRLVLTSVAQTDHHDGGDQTDVDVNVGVHNDTIAIPVARKDSSIEFCPSYLFLRRGHLQWATVKSWNPVGSSWDRVSQLADSLTMALRQ
jgi:hypothetical protein